MENCKFICHSSKILLSFDTNCDNIYYLAADTWRDTKTKVPNKVTSLKKNRVATDNKSNDIVLTERDKKVIDLIGCDYIEGLATVPNSFCRRVCKLVTQFQEIDFYMYKLFFFQ